MSHETAEMIDQELRTARRRFPSTRAVYYALVEEVGELAKALMEESDCDVRTEAVQVAAMAIRIIEEGDPTIQGLRDEKGLGET